MSDTEVSAIKALRDALAAAREVGAITDAEWRVFAMVPVGQGDGAALEAAAALCRAPTPLDRDRVAGLIETVLADISVMAGNGEGGAGEFYRRGSDGSLRGWSVGDLARHIADLITTTPPPLNPSPAVERGRDMAREAELRQEFRNGWDVGVLCERAQAHHRLTQNTADEAPTSDPGGDLARRIEPGDGAVCS